MTSARLAGVVVLVSSLALAACGDSGDTPTTTVAPNTSVAPPTEPAGVSCAAEPAGAVAEALGPFVDEGMSFDAELGTAASPHGMVIEGRFDAAARRVAVTTEAETAWVRVMVAQEPALDWPEGDTYTVESVVDLDTGILYVRSTTFDDPWQRVELDFGEPVAIAGVPVVAALLELDPAGTVTACRAGSSVTFDVAVDAAPFLQALGVSGVGPRLVTGLGDLAAGRTVEGQVVVSGAAASFDFGLGPALAGGADVDPLAEFHAPLYDGADPRVRVDLVAGPVDPVDIPE